MNASLADLNRRFGLPGQLEFRTLGDGTAGLVAAEIGNAHATATISLHGGQLLAWHPLAQPEPVIWLSGGARFAPGRAIRGGVPVCWPWFGPHPSRPKLSSHGFARTSAWTVRSARRLDRGTTEIVLALAEPGARDGFDASRYALELTATIGATLRLELATRNDGTDPFTISEALHSYYRIGDIGAVAIDGLDGATYIDQAGGGERRRQAGAIRFAGEVDYLFVDTVATCTIDDPQLGRMIRITKSGSRSTIVWSPAQAKAERLGDLGRSRSGGEGWREMVCVECANAADNTVRVEPGTHHRLALEVDVA